MNQEVGGSILSKCNFQKRKKGVVGKVKRVGRVVGRETGRSGQGAVHKE